ACAHIWRAADQILASDDPQARSFFLAFVQSHMPPRAQARFLRLLARDPSPRLRTKVRRLLQRNPLREGALPQERTGTWDTTGWFPRTGRETGGKGLARHRQGRKIQDRTGVPPIANLGQLRKLLDIRSPSQLGWFLLASDAADGPYVKFTIPKNDGG